MPCDDCNKKKRGVIVHDNWKAGATNTVKSGGVQVGRANMAIGRQSNRFAPYGGAGGAPAMGKSGATLECKSCSKKLMQAAKYCMECANKKGKCSLCGIKLLDTKGVGVAHASLKRK
eukprot:TRINITY_DN22710_c0_g1_i1.p2 TRINITY_DN22710_c0_g1~~TRINITY_DN22710_c0_g1_i1.p2  ORF type:complete len:117 (+),score=39.44 TRINITY_DN22710_c0_g1_i1:90-440(+)